MCDGLELGSDALLQRMRKQVFGDCEDWCHSAEKQQKHQSQAPQAQRSFSTCVPPPAPVPVCGSVSVWLDAQRSTLRHCWLVWQEGLGSTGKEWCKLRQMWILNALCCVYSIMPIPYRRFVWVNWNCLARNDSVSHRIWSVVPPVFACLWLASYNIWVVLPQPLIFSENPAIDVFPFLFMEVTPS